MNFIKNMYRLQQTDTGFFGHFTVINKAKQVFLSLICFWALLVMDYLVNNFESQIYLQILHQTLYVYYVSQVDQDKI
jgi:hypothetical protein